MKNLNNYVKIPASYLEAKAKIRIPGCADQILSVIERKTFGWHKDQDGISLNQFKELTKIKHIRNIRRNLEILKKMKIIDFKNLWGLRTEYQILRNYSLWKTCGKPVEKAVENVAPCAKKRTVTVRKKAHSTVRKKAHSQKILSKERILKGRSIYREKTKNSPMEKTKTKKIKKER